MANKAQYFVNVLYDTIILIITRIIIVIIMIMMMIRIIKNKNNVYNDIATIYQKGQNNWSI